MRGFGRATRWISLLAILVLMYLLLLMSSSAHMRVARDSFDADEMKLPIRFNDKNILNNIEKAKSVVAKPEIKTEITVPHRATVVMRNSKLGHLPKEIDVPLHKEPPFSYMLQSSKYGAIEIVDVLTAPLVSLKTRLTANIQPNQTRMIVSLDAGHSAANLGGCRDWQCTYSTNAADAEKADVVMMIFPGVPHYQRPSSNPNQLLVFFSQESPKNMGVPGQETLHDYFNVSLGFRHDTLASSPYGYTVKLAKNRSLDTVVNRTLLASKSLPAVWFVSHCDTNSGRERLVEEMKKSIDVDVFGACSGRLCARNGECEEKLNTHYYFYLSFENSVCADYITEKVWFQGYKKDIIPVVLKRSIVENRLPPRSFLAVDDYDTVEELTTHMHYLIQNKTAYFEYFKWRTDYAVIFLDGSTHDALERPWGFCQLCRLAWLAPEERHDMLIHDFEAWWDGSCEPDGETVDKLLKRTPAPPNGKPLRADRANLKRGSTDYLS